MNLPDHIIRQMDFSANAFGPGTRQKGVCAHIRQELDEIDEGDNDPKEWVDVWLLAMDGLWRSLRDRFVELTDFEIAVMICEMIDAKQTKNEGRIWPDWRLQSPDEAINHVRGVND